MDRHGDERGGQDDTPSHYVTFGISSITDFQVSINPPLLVVTRTRGGGGAVKGRLKIRGNHATSTGAVACPRQDGDAETPRNPNTPVWIFHPELTGGVEYSLLGTTLCLFSEVFPSR
ncbi:hypothetical protein J6590_024937 [Homalodisca vitripennis]|nr:hypothetical protein J6590_024937 [Homalodisca vitripennis]